MKVKKKIALVTGSSKGIGKAIAIRLAKEDYVVYITYMTDKSGGENVVQKIEELGGKAHLLKLDVRSEEEVKSAFNQIKQDYGRLNVLVNNAGIEISKEIEKVSFNEWKNVTETKINGNFLCTKYALPLLKNQENANLICITSNLGNKPDHKFPAYCVGTAGVIAFTKMMAVQLGKYGIRTNGISPGTTRTPMWDCMNGDNNSMWNDFAKNNPMERVSTPEDIANAVMMIINDESKYLNGNFIFVNGGGHLK
jgi:NAD(P)-dependent dehydrogenase (short-subunit alcohol dehydrogenase family)